MAHSRGRSMFMLLRLLLLLSISIPIAAQTGTITGRTTDATGAGPVSGVQVFMPAVERGTLTGQDGSFTISDLPAGTYTLRAERLGFRPETADVTVSAGQTTVLNIAMTQAVLAIDQVVVTGVPGGTRRRAVGNVVGNIDVAAMIGDAPVRSVTDVLGGRASSVNILGAGMVGAGPQVRIRGQSTLSLDSNPLVYIDGVRVSNAQDQGIASGAGSVRSMLATLNPDEIQSIEVLKGPAAATLYGTEASRGVVNILTRRGQEGPATMTFSVRQGANFIMDPENNPGYENYWTDPAGGVVYGPLNMVRHMKDQGKDIFSYGRIQSYNLSISGGRDDLRYFLSSALSDETGIYSHNWQKRFNMRANVEANATEDLRISVSSGFVRNRDRIPYDGFQGILQGVVFGNPRWLPENFCRTNPGPNCGLLDGWQARSIPSVDEADINTQDVNRFTGSLTATHNTTSWLTTRLNLGLDFVSEENLLLREFQVNDTIRFSLGPNGSLGFRDQSRVNRLNTTMDLSATSDVPLNDAILSSTSVGIQYYTRDERFIRARGEQFAGPGLRVIDATNVRAVTSDNFLTNNTLGAYFQQTLAFRDRLFLTGAVRVDNNSAFGSEIDLVTYPKVSVSWVLDEEAWYQNHAPNWVNSMRVRLAYGQSGEQPPSFVALRTYAPVSSPTGAGVSPSSLGNPELSPEVGEEIEGGFDASVFNGRLAVEFSFYNKRTKDAILLRSVPPSLGFTGQTYTNAGLITNQGLELTLNGLVVGAERMSWTAGLNLSTNSAEIVRLSGEPGDTAIVMGGFGEREHRVGHAPHTWFSVRPVSAEYDPATRRPINMVCDDGIGGTMPCFNQAGQIQAPRVAIGRALPSLEIGLTNDFTIGSRIRISTLVTSASGHKRYDNTARQRHLLFQTSREMNFREEADPVLLATALTSDRFHAEWIRDVGFVRLKEITLSYNVPNEVANRFGVRSATWRVSGRNLLTLTNWTDTDPEVMRNDGRLFMSQHNMPLPQSIETAISVTF